MNNNFFVLCEKLGEFCIANNKRVALAESCTGGSVSSVITDVPGASAWFNGSAVVYSNTAKINLLDVDGDLIKQHGAVSEPVAIAMAQGALKKFDSDIAVSITGIAGPFGATAEKSVGTVCFALAIKAQGTCEAKTLHFTSGRQHIRQCASVAALEWLIKYAQCNSSTPFINSQF